MEKAGISEEITALRLNRSGLKGETEGHVEHKIEENCTKELEMKPGKPSQYEVQKIVINGTAHILIKILG